MRPGLVGVCIAAIVFATVDHPLLERVTCRRSWLGVDAIKFLHLCQSVPNEILLSCSWQGSTPLVALICFNLSHFNSRTCRVQFAAVFGLVCQFFSP